MRDVNDFRLILWEPRRSQITGLVAPDELMLTDTHKCLYCCSYSSSRHTIGFLTPLALLTASCRLYFYYWSASRSDSVRVLILTTGLRLAIVLGRNEEIRESQSELLNLRKHERSLSYYEMRDIYLVR